MAIRFLQVAYLVHSCYSGSKLAPDLSDKSYETLNLSELLHFLTRLCSSIHKYQSVMNKIGQSWSGKVRSLDLSVWSYLPSK